MSLLRPAILGGVDGIITSFAIVVSSHVGQFKQSTLLIVGIASLVADGISMGISEYLSTRTMNSRISYQRNILSTNLESGERRNLIVKLENELVSEQNMNRNDAHRICTIASNYPVIFNRLSGLDIDTSGRPAWILGIVCAFSFITLGSIPLVSYVPSNNIYACVSFSLVALFTLGYFRESENKLNSFVETGVLGVFAGAVAFGCAIVVDNVSE